MSLFSVVIRIADVTKEGLTKLRWRHLLKTSEVEGLKSRHAGEVNAMGQVTLKFFNLHFKVNLLNKQTSHLFAHFLLVSFATV